jgi:hypothetical protein
MQQMYADLLAAIARQAVIDYHAEYHHPGIPDATRFLEAAGLLEQTIKAGPVRRAQRNRRSTAHEYSSLESARPAPGGR